MDWKKIVQDLLAKASHANTPKEESETYQEKAMYIMAKYGIDEAMFRQRNDSKEKPTFQIFKQFQPYAHTKVLLLSAVVNVLGGKLVQSGKDLYVFAYAGDLERIQMLYFSLLAQMHIESAEVKVPQSISKRAYTDSWLKGFVFGVTKRLQSAYQRATGNGQELVVLRESQLQKAAEEKFNKIRPKQVSLSPSDHSAFDHGEKSGLRADVGQDRISKVAGSKALTNKP